MGGSCTTVSSDSISLVRSCTGCAGKGKRFVEMNFGQILATAQPPSARRSFPLRVINGDAISISHLLMPPMAINCWCRWRMYVHTQRTPITEEEHGWGGVGWSWPRWNLSVVQGDSCTAAVNVKLNFAEKKSKKCVSSVVFQACICIYIYHTYTPGASIIVCGVLYSLQFWIQFLYRNLCWRILPPYPPLSSRSPSVCASLSVCVFSLSLSLYSGGFPYFLLA